jgi:hypothetical protein
MKKGLAVLLLLTLLSGAAGASAQVERNALLDTAFSMLEFGNPILQRYNEITGADVQVRYTLGLPYFFGGKKADLLMTIGVAQETTRNYKQGERYIYGFDCAGYTNWINAQTGRPQHDTLEYMITKYFQYKDNQLPIKDVQYDQLKEYLQIGDYLVGKIRGRHILMYIGTLADYGYTAENAPELASYLDYPILIHCGSNPAYTERYAKYIGDNHLNCNITSGGVSISIFGVHKEDAPHVYRDSKENFHYFDLNGYMLTIYDIFSATSYVWFRL